MQFDVSLASFDGSNFNKGTGILKKHFGIL